MAGSGPRCDRRPHGLNCIEPFKRVDDDADVTGFGLGLAIAKYAVERHGGSIQARRGEEGGLMIEIVLPRRAPAFERIG